MITEVSTGTQNNYQYQLYHEYLTQIKRNSLLCAYNPELVVKYYNINLNKSNNYNSEDYKNDLIPNTPGTRNDGTSIATNFRDYTYDLFEFTPIIEMTPFAYNDTQGFNEGITGSLSFITIEKPNVGDLFTYYSNDDVYDKTEIFQVTSVNFQRTSRHILPIFEVQFKTALITLETLKKLSINNIFFYDSFQNKFLSSDCYEEYNKVQADPKLINSLYNKKRNFYEFKLGCTSRIIPIVPLLFNNLINRLSKYPYTSFKQIKNMSCNLSINEFLDPSTVDILPEYPKKQEGSDPDEVPPFEKYINFIIFDKWELYNLYLAFGMKKEDIPLSNEEIQLDSPNRYSETPIAFLDRDMISKKYILIDSYSQDDLKMNNFNAFLILYNLILLVKKLMDCPFDHTVIKDDLKDGFDDKSKIGKIFNIFDCPLDKEVDKKITRIQPTIFYNSNGLIADDMELPEIIGSLKLPLAISFQYGVQ